MKRFLRIVLVCMSLLVFGNLVVAEDKKEYKEGRYLVIEGKVSRIVARSLEIDGQQFPISMFAQVFDKTGNALSIKIVADRGKIDKAKVYVLGGKVERIVVIENI